MRFLAEKAMVIGVLLTLVAGHAAAKPAPSTSKHSSKSHHRRSRRGAWKRHGQQGMQPDRIREIQQALIRDNYLTGEPTGKWDTRTQDAMAHYQTVNGWQGKITPDSRALIKLGLGPNYSDKELVQPGSKPTAGPAASDTSATGLSKR